MTIQHIREQNYVLYAVLGVCAPSSARYLSPSEYHLNERQILTLGRLSLETIGDQLLDEQIRGIFRNDRNGQRIVGQYALDHKYVVSNVLLTGHRSVMSCGIQLNDFNISRVIPLYHLDAHANSVRYGLEVNMVHTCSKKDLSARLSQVGFVTKEILQLVCSEI